MVDFGKDFWDAQKLFLGIINKSIDEFETFIHIKAFINGVWYNFIVPKVLSPEDLDTEAIDRIVGDEAKNGTKLGHYIHDSLRRGYIPWLKERELEGLGDDLLMLNNVVRNEVVLPTGYGLTTDFDSGKAKVMLAKCFPTWLEFSEYFDMFIGYKAAGQPGRDFIDYVVTYEGQPVGSCSIVVDRTAKISYIHNSGVAEEHRRKGLFSNLVKACENYSLENGVSRVTCLVDGADDSFAGFQKLGYGVAADFKIFAKE